MAAKRTRRVSFAEEKKEKRAVEEEFSPPSADSFETDRNDRSNTFEKRKTGEKGGRKEKRETEEKREKEERERELFSRSKEKSNAVFGTVLGEKAFSTFREEADEPTFWDSLEPKGESETERRTARKEADEPFLFDYSQRRRTFEDVGDSEETQREKRVKEAERERKERERSFFRKSYGSEEVESVEEGRRRSEEEEEEKEKEEGERECESDEKSCFRRVDAIVNRFDRVFGAMREKTNAKKEEEIESKRRFSRHSPLRATSYGRDNE